MKMIQSGFLLVLLLCVGISSCGKAENNTNDNGNNSGENAKSAAGLMKDFDLSAKPEGVKELAEVLNDEQAGKEIAARGKLGEFVKGKAKFRFVDSSVKDCYGNDCDCGKPWDYCCASQEDMKAKSAMVEFKKKAGEAAVAVDIVNFKDLYFGATVIIKGTLRKTTEGNFYIDASGFFVEEKSKLDIAKVSAAWNKN